MDLKFSKACVDKVRDIVGQKYSSVVITDHLGILIDNTSKDNTGWLYGYYINTWDRNVIDLSYIQFDADTRTASDVSKDMFNPFREMKRLTRGDWNDIMSMLENKFDKSIEELTGNRLFYH